MNMPVMLDPSYVPPTPVSDAARIAVTNCNHTEGEWQITTDDEQVHTVNAWDELVEGEPETFVTCTCQMMAIQGQQEYCTHIVYVLFKYGNPPAGRRVPLEVKARQQSIFGNGFVGPQLKIVKAFLKRNLPQLLFGPTGTGKSMLVEQACRENGQKLYSIVASKGTQDRDLLGIYVRRDDGFVWEDGLLVKAMREGAKFFVDELNRMSTEHQNILMEVLSYNRVTVLEHGSEVVEAKSGFSLIAACNIGLEYVGTNAIDPALFSKFLRKIRFDYPDRTTEAILITKRVGLDDPMAMRLAQIAQDFRVSFKQGEYMAPLNTRSLLEWASEIANGELPLEAARSTFMYEMACTPEQEDAITRLVRDKFANVTVIGRQAKTGNGKAAG